MRGVLEANAKFRETTRLNIRVSSLSLVELYQDTAITAVYALREMPDKLRRLSRSARTRCSPAGPSSSRARACASACSTAAARATGRA